MAALASLQDVNTDAFSGICGTISIVTWVVVFNPQVYKNFRRGSYHGLSLHFLVVWLLGDIFNVVGAVLQGVRPTMIIFAIYFTVADVVLLAQCFFYRGFTWKDDKPANPTTHTYLCMYVRNMAMSVEGLSVLFFLFACLRNSTYYVLSILAFDSTSAVSNSCLESCEAREIYGSHILVSLPWLVDGLGTMLLDGAIFAQFLLYGEVKPAMDEV
ncbi:hypothetical protein COCVIDRAFT_41526 [Bipolaris victoriae FI3]|uniref:Uncharacterized protein n=1 Tax=Bipolaris victoriae (strain FI3) TaxID=930091 RepID=W7E3B7_BIPV3|nr:hypothetical protein COCVIDRAFT_41526 [Bipolaris victoriae FI3]